MFYIAFEGRYGGTTPDLDARWCISQASNNKSVLNHTPGLKGNVETYSIMWQAMWVGEKNQILYCVWLPNGQGDAIQQEYSVHFTHNKLFMGQACLVKGPGYWPCSYFACE